METCLQYVHDGFEGVIIFECTPESGLLYFEVVTDEFHMIQSFEAMDQLAERHLIENKFAPTP